MPTGLSARSHSDAVHCNTSNAFFKKTQLPTNQRSVYSVVKVVPSAASLFPTNTPLIFDHTLNPSARNPACPTLSFKLHQALNAVTYSY